MRYSLLNFIFCPSCGGQLTTIAFEEIITEVNNDSSAAFNKTNEKTYPGDVLNRNSSDVLNRINNISAVIGPVPHFRRNTTFTKILTKHSSSPYLPDRKQDVDNVDIKKGLLVCGECGHWYPVSNFVPELLPDHLRDWEKDVKFLSEFSESMPKK